MARGRFGAPRDPRTGRYIKVTFKSELDVVALEFEAAAREMSPRLKAVIEGTCDRIVRKAKDNVLKTAPIHNAGAHKYIDSEVKDKDGVFEAVVGYNPALNKAANLGNLLEFGNGRDPSPAHWDLALALESEERRFYDKIEDEAESVLVSRWGSIQSGKDLRHER